jgi:hypothetical protein
MKNFDFFSDKPQVKNTLCANYILIGIPISQQLRILLYEICYNFIAGFWRSAK